MEDILEYVYISLVTAVHLGTLNATNFHPIHIAKSSVLANDLATTQIKSILPPLFYI